MKIAITADPELPVPPEFYGGIERIVFLLVKGLKASGHDVTLFAHKNSQTPARLIAWPGTSSQSFLDTVKNTLTLTKACFIHRFDVVHSFSRLAYLFPLLPFSFPKIMSYQREPTLSQIKKACKMSLQSLYFTGCSTYITNQIKPYAPAITVYNCVSFDDYHLGFCADDAPLVFLGRIEPVKGAHLAIKIAQKSGHSLIIAGNIPAGHEAYFSREIKPHIDGKFIRYIGPVNDRQKNELLGGAKAFLMPILWDEPFGIVMIEAMACGTPVLALNRGAVSEIIEPGLTGFYADTIDELLVYLNNTATMARQQIRNTAQKRFDAAHIVNEYLQHYQKLV